MASKRERNGAYQITVSLGYDKNGKKKLKTATWTPDPAKTKKQNEDELSYFIADFERKAKSGKSLDAEKLTFADLVDIWREDHGKTQLEATSLERIDIILQKALPALGDVLLSEMRPKHIKDFLKGLQKEGYVKGAERREYAESTLQRYKGGVSAILGYAVDEEIMTENPCTRAKLPKVAVDPDEDPDDTPCFTADEAKAFLAYLNSDYTVTHRGRPRKDGLPSAEKTYTRKVNTKTKLFFVMALKTGLRRGELLGLRWQDIDTKKGTITVKLSAAHTKDLGQHNKGPKNRPSRRTVPLAASVVPLLKEYKHEQAEYRKSLGTKWQGSKTAGDLWQAKQHLFTQWNGKQMHINTASHTFAKIIARYNKTTDGEPLPLIPLHGLRHSTASLLIAEGVDPVTVAAILGHADTRTTLSIYSHFFKENAEKAINALDNALEEKQA
ncbi:MAG: site-specific integrase [Lachnospiraceae bacterium]|jgi:integrase|nr:site-specific integrase [Lachnospiraceae bacterium]